MVPLPPPRDPPCRAQTLLVRGGVILHRSWGRDDTRSVMYGSHPPGLSRWGGVGELIPNNDDLGSSSNGSSNFYFLETFNN